MSALASAASVPVSAGVRGECGGDRRHVRQVRQHPAVLSNKFASTGV